MTSREVAGIPYQKKKKEKKRRLAFLIQKKGD
jgi:hypothetical protein